MQETRRRGAEVCRDRAGAIFEMISEYHESRDKTMEVKTEFRGKTYDKVYSGLKDKTSEGVYFRLKDNTSDMSILC